MSWTPIDGYTTGDYVDDSVFEVDYSTKQIQQITDQTMVSGENKSQFIRFIMDRYYDGVDLIDKNIQIIYQTEDGDSDINMAVCAEYSDDQLRFGWLVPLGACYSAGTLSFGIEIVGSDYTWKSRTYDIEVYDGLNGGEIIPEPESVWYIELQSRCSTVLDAAEDYADAASDSADAAATSESNASSYMARAESAADSAEDSADAAAASETNAQTYAEQAAAVFNLAGDVSFVIGSDNGVTMIFTEGE